LNRKTGSDPESSLVNTVDLQSIEHAHQRIARYIRRTPVLASQQIDELTGAYIRFKCENFQRTGAFKYRGALNAVLALGDAQAIAGVATHSSGNHGAALALAANRRGIPAHIVMPENASRVKLAAVSHYKGTIHLCKPTLQAREEKLAEVVKITSSFFVPPYDDERIVAGQGTAALEALQQIAVPDDVITPVGGGGLLAGTAIAISARVPGARIFGAEPEGADDAYRSFKSGTRVTSHQPDTIADGLLTTLGRLNFSIIKSKVSDIMLVNEAEIVEAMRLIWSRMKIIVEPSSAVPLAAVLRNKTLFAGRNVLIILSGGNVDLDKLPW
jgi:threonine dehydratase